MSEAFSAVLLSREVDSITARTAKIYASCRDKRVREQCRLLAKDIEKGRRRAARGFIALGDSSEKPIELTIDPKTGEITFKD